MELLLNDSNKVVLLHKDAIYLFSYLTLVCTYNKKTKQIKKDNHFYSKTTSKHINEFINSIKNGDYDD